MKEILGKFVGDEQRAQTEDSSGMGDDLSHNEYRALVMNRALALGQGKPSTKHFYAAKTTVDQSLGRAGVAINIPGAKPGRRTV